MSASAWKNMFVVESFIKGGRAAIPNAADQLNTMLHLLRHNEKPVNSFIDLGAGDGILSQLILEQFRDAQAYLLDFSDPMIDAAHIRLENYSDRVKIIRSDISSPDWQDDVFQCGFEKADAIVSGYCIHHLSHGRKYALFNEIFRHLSHKGLFINIEHVASKSVWGEKQSNEAFIDSIFSHQDEKSREEISIKFHSRQDKKDNILLSAETQCEWLRLIGFEDVDIFFKSFELAVFAGRNPLNVE